MSNFPFLPQPIQHPHPSFHPNKHTPYALRKKKPTVRCFQSADFPSPIENEQQSARQNHSINRSD